MSKIIVVFAVFLSDWNTIFSLTGLIKCRALEFEFSVSSSNLVVSWKEALQFLSGESSPPGGRASNPVGIETQAPPLAERNSAGEESS